VERFDAIVLAGGGGSRLGGVDKAAIVIGGRSLLDRALDAVSSAASVVVVGPDRPLPPGVMSASEQPPGGGPVAGIVAGLSSAGREALVVVVLACDVPLVAAADIDVLVSAAMSSAAQGALFVDSEGRRQPLVAAYRTSALRAAVAALGTARNAAMRELTSRLTLTEIEADAELTLDCDTWDDVARSRNLLEDR